MELSNNEALIKAVRDRSAPVVMLANLKEKVKILHDDLVYKLRSKEVKYTTVDRDRMEFMAELLWIVDIMFETFNVDWVAYNEAIVDLHRLAEGWSNTDTEEWRKILIE